MTDGTLWILTGPTASGKSGLALELAQRRDCEIVCMDSMQIYRGMDIGTAKPTAREQALVPHHMLDVCDPREAYSVVQWVEDALGCIRDIHSRGRRALLVGGTGFYLRALRHPMAMGQTPGDPAIRARLTAEAEEPGGKEKLHAALAACDPETAGRLHPNDVRRVVRALEVWEVTGIPFSRQPQREEPPPFPSRCVCLTLPRERLYERINTRVEQMMAQGLAEEVRTLLEAGVPEDSQAMQGIGYKEMIPCVRGLCTAREAGETIAQNTRHYAKRQMTWFRGEKDMAWLEADAPDALKRLEDSLLGGEA